MCQGRVKGISWRDRRVIWGGPVGACSLDLEFPALPGSRVCPWGMWVVWSRGGQGTGLSGLPGSAMGVGLVWGGVLTSGVNGLPRLGRGAGAKIRGDGASV